MLVILRNANTIVIIMDYAIMGLVLVLVSFQVIIVTNWHVKITVTIMGTVIKGNAIAIKGSKEIYVRKEW